MTEDVSGRSHSGRERPPEAPTRRCDLCGATAIERNCKIVCLNCGYQRDCSDP